MKQKPKELDWEKEFDENFCERVFNPTGEYSHLIIAYNERNPEKFKNFISKTLQQQREEIIKEIEGIVKENRKGTFTDEGGNDCWYIDDLVKELKVLEKK